MSMTFATIADIHVGPAGFFNGVQRKLTHHAAELTAAFVQQINADPTIACVLQLGDLIQDQDPTADRANLQTALTQLARLRTPLYHTLGNHDLMHLPVNEVLQLLGQAQPYYSVDIGGYHIVCLWSQPRSPGSLEASIDGEQLAWLQRDLVHNRRPTIVFTHYALADQELIGNPWFAGLPEQCLLANRTAVRDLLAASETVMLVLNGHLHWNHFAIHDDIPYVTLQSPTENFRNDGTPAATYARIDVHAKRIIVDIVGNDAARFEHTYRRLHLC